jgi:perosamine synthetase
MKSGWVSSLGKYVNEFEEKFAEFCNAKFAVSTSNGTTALHLAMLVNKIGRGDEVIVPDLTFVATANAVAYTGAKVICADINPKTLCIDVNKIEQRITPRTKAIITVHLYGYPADMVKLNQLGLKYKIPIIEDAAEAHGAMLFSKKIGALGQCGIFSFYGNKIITTGEGGMLVTNDYDIYLKARYFRDHAMSASKKYWHDDVGYNYRLTNIQAALGVSQLKRIEEIIERKREIYHFYKENFSDIEVTLNPTDPTVRNVYWLVNIQCELFNRRIRDQFIEELYKSNVEARPYFYPISQLPMYESNDNCDNANASLISQQGVSLPSFVDITFDEMNAVVSAVKNVFKTIPKIKNKALL